MDRYALSGLDFVNITANAKRKCRHDQICANKFITTDAVMHKLIA